MAASTAAPRSTPLIDRPEPLPVPSSILGDDDRRPAEAFLEAAGDDPDHALVPAAAHHDDHRRVGLGLGLLRRLLGDQHLDRPALLVEPVELGGDGPRFLGIGRW